MGKLWQKEYTNHALLEEFTVGRDPELDARLLPADCLASIAHGQVLLKAKLLTEAEFLTLKKGLLQVLGEFQEGKLTILRSDEDCHTAIENRLTEICGEAGKKIHTGRSRNDQVVTALRVAGRFELLAILENLGTLVGTLATFAEKHQKVPMPGRTHMQTGMPSSVGLWAAAYAEELLDDGILVRHSLDLFNQGSLGSAAGYGVPLPLDRELASRLLGFPKVQNNVIYVSNSRGKYESVILDALDQVGLTLSKLAQDLILFSLPEFGYFSLPKELTTGSSIMPQKKNPDGLELTRAKSALLSGYAQQVKGIIRSLPSGYNRDFQDTKEPFLRGMEQADILLRISTLTIQGLQVHQGALEKAFTPDIFATDAAYAMVLAGKPFREAYKEVGTNLDKLGDWNPADTIGNRTHIGSAGNLGLEVLRSALQGFQDSHRQLKEGIDAALESLTHGI